MYFDYAQYKQKGSAHLFVVFGIMIILGLGAAYFYFSKVTLKDNLQKLSETSPARENNLTTYIDKKFGFQFQYPKKEFSVKEDSEEEFFKRGGGDFRKNFANYVSYEPGKFLGAVTVLDKSDSFDKSPFTLWIFDNQSNLSIEAWYDKYWYYPFVWGDYTYNGKVKTKPDKIATVSGQVANSGIVDYQPGSPKFVYLVKDGRIYLFRLINGPDNIGDKILSSFKLLDNHSEDEKQKIDEWIKKNDLNQYGDAKDIAYPGGTPLFNEATGERLDRYEYIIQKHPDRPWKN